MQQNTRRLFVGSIGSLLIAITGLFLVCAVHRETMRGPKDEEAYRRELIELLGLEEEIGEEKVATPDTSEVTPAPQAELAVAEAVPRVDEAAASELFDLLEKLDRMRRVVDQQEKEIAELERESLQLDSEIQRLTSKLAQVRGGDVRLAGRPSPSRTVQVMVTVPPGEQASVAQPPSTFEDRYQEALRLFHQRRYGEALAQFQSLLMENPRHPLADNCQYWTGECLFGQGKYLEAVAEFAKVFCFDPTDKYDDAQIMIALCYIRLGDRERARYELQEFLKFYPRSEYIATAKSYLARLSA